MTLSNQKTTPETHPDTQGEAHRLFERVSRERFDALALWGMPQQMREDTLSASHWSADNERVIAGVFHVVATKEFMCVAFARDTAGRYRPLQRSHFLPSARAGELALRRNFGRALLTVQPEFPAAHEQPKGVHLFATLGNIERHHDAYVMLRDGFNQGAARALLEEVSRWVSDLDGNLVRDFQTSGYSARVTASSCFSAPKPRSWVRSCSQPVRGNLTVPFLMYRAATRRRARLSLIGCIAVTAKARRSSSSIAACWYWTASI